MAKITVPLQDMSGGVFDISGVLTSENSVSLASSLDFYKKLNKVFNDKESQISKLLAMVCDASYYINNMDEFTEWAGFRDSIFRDGEVPKSILRNGYQVAIGRYRPKKKFSLDVDVSSNSFEPVMFNFDRSRVLGKTNINLLVGTNGVGKTHVLKYISDVISGVVESSTEWPCFNKMIVVAYSPFEDFYTKSELIKKKEKKHTFKKNKKNKKSVKLLKVNDYEYIGFRNDNERFDLKWPKEKSARSIFSILNYDSENTWFYEESKLKRLFDTLGLSIDFDEISLALSGGEELRLGKDDLLAEPESYRNKIKFEVGVSFLKNGKKLALSSGQLIYSYMLPALVAEIVEESLIVIDEPELYLHPAMEIGLIKMLKSLLSDTKSAAIVATHSSVIVREVERKAVVILRKEQGITKAYPPTFETYGAPVDLINGEVFDDDYTVKPFQDSMDRLIRKNDGDIKAVIKKYSKNIGDDALIYLASKNYSYSSDIEIEE